MACYFCSSSDLNWNIDFKLFEKPIQVCTDSTILNYSAICPNILMDLMYYLIIMYRLKLILTDKLMRKLKICQER